MLPMFIFLFLIENAHSSYANKCLEEVPPTKVLLKQSFPIETVYYEFLRQFYFPASNNEFTIGSGVINDPMKYKLIQFIDSNPFITLTFDAKHAENARLENGDSIVRNSLADRKRYEWTCPAGIYSLPYKNANDISYMDKSPDGNLEVLRPTTFPVNHNYFINMQLNADITVYAGYGSIVIHSVNLNGFIMTLILQFDFYHVVQGAKSIPMIQITNNYGPGNIIIEYQEKLGDTLLIRDVVHGGNEKDVKIQINQISGNQRRFDVELVDFTKPVKQYAEPQPKSADIDEEDDEQIGEEFFEDGPSTTGDSSFILLILGLVFFVLAIAMVITPFIIPKDNNFELLELYEYYEGKDEL